MVFFSTKTNSSRISLDPGGIFTYAWIQKYNKNIETKLPFPFSMCSDFYGLAAADSKWDLKGDVLLLSKFLRQS